MESEPVVAEVDGVALAGSCWMPSSPRAAVLMLPGSGPSTRDNDVYFPAIREHLLAAGFGVASFDKRGVGESTGSLLDTSIDRQADDALACLTTLRTRTANLPWGVFGHSQGGWVAFEVAARDRSLFAAVANSGPAVGVAEQERFRILGTPGPSGETLGPDAHRRFDELTQAVASGAGHAEAMALVADVPDLAAEFAEMGDAWPLVATLLGHDPERTLRSIAIPTLCVYGSRERVVPVTSCLAVLDRVGNPHLDVAVIAGGDHRLQLDDETFAPGYVATVVGFLAAHC